MSQNAYWIDGESVLEFNQFGQYTSVWIDGEPRVIGSRTAPGVQITLDQHSYRFFNNNGNEASSTTRANINVSPTVIINDILRLRFLLNATGDVSSKSFKLEYRYEPPGQSFGQWETVV